jgi:hypothetical protein
MTKTKTPARPRMTYKLFFAKLKKYRKMFEVRSTGTIRTTDSDRYCPIAYIMNKDYAKTVRGLYGDPFVNSSADSACDVWRCSTKDMALRIIEAADTTTDQLASYRRPTARTSMRIRAAMLKALGLKELDDQPA